MVVLAWWLIPFVVAMAWASMCDTALQQLVHNGRRSDNRDALASALRAGAKDCMDANRRPDAMFLCSLLVDAKVDGGDPTAGIIAAAETCGYSEPTPVGSVGEGRLAVAIGRAHWQAQHMRLALLHWRSVADSAGSAGLQEADALLSLASTAESNLAAAWVGERKRVTVQLTRESGGNRTVIADMILYLDALLAGDVGSLHKHGEAAAQAIAAVGPPHLPSIIRHSSAQLALLLLHARRSATWGRFDILEASLSRIAAMCAHVLQRTAPKHMSDMDDNLLSACAWAARVWIPYSFLWYSPASGLSQTEVSVLTIHHALQYKTTHGAQQAGHDRGQKRELHVVLLTADARDHALGYLLEGHVCAVPPGAAVAAHRARLTILHYGPVDTGSVARGSSVNSNLSNAILRAFIPEGMQPVTQFDRLVACASAAGGAVLLARSATSPDMLCSLLRTAGASVVVDSMGFANGARLDLSLGCAAATPAPWSWVSYMYPASTGVVSTAARPALLFADAATLPPDSLDLGPSTVAEMVLFMPTTFQVNSYALQWQRAKRDEQCGCRQQNNANGLIRKQHTVSAVCFAAIDKIEPIVWQLWCNILRRARRATLTLLCAGEEEQGGSAAADQLRLQAAACGILPSQLLCAPLLPRKQHLDRIAKEADLVVDTLAVGGHTNTADAVSSGVPVITLAGAKLGTRVSASLLRASRVSGAMPLSALLETHSLQEYEEVAVWLMSHPDLLQAMRTRVLAATSTTADHALSLQHRHKQLWVAYAAATELSGTAAASWAAVVQGAAYS